MAMSKSVRRELAAARELLWFLLAKETCFFCKHSILTAEDRELLREWVRFGNRQTPPCASILSITEHHLDGDHENNDPDNIALSHSCCHKRHHANEAFSGLNGVTPKNLKPSAFRALLDASYFDGKGGR
jgi:hypothetical protein